MLRGYETKGAMPNRVLIAVAWPYANGNLHLGHIAGCYLPADIFARYNRLKGNEVVMVSGSDQHGTPITIRAEQDNTTPQDIVGRYHANFLRDWDRLGISFDLFTSTGTENHVKIVQEIFSVLLEKGHIYKDTMNLPYCKHCNRFLPDRYVEGTCPKCGNEKTRGDQCEKCGATLNPEDLIGIRCRLSGHTPIIKPSEHFFLKLPDFEQQLTKWVNNQKHWRPNVKNFTVNFLKEGLKPRAITRDTEWGIPIPVPGYSDKRIYVWFEAVIGYLSATKEWATAFGDAEKWQSYWHDKACKSYYFIGKDNIPFHTIIWPAILLAYGKLNMPYDVPANEFLSLEGKKFSTSENWALWLKDYLDRYEPDPLRYYLSASAPEKGDSDFSWSEYVRKVNDELVATYGNLVHRVLTFTYRNFDGKIPTPNSLSKDDQAMIAAAEDMLKKADSQLSLCHFREALATAMGLATKANRYIDNQAPWHKIKESPERCATILWTTIYVICALKTATYPYLPITSEKLNVLLGSDESLTKDGWGINPPEAGTSIPEPSPLFTKLDPEIVETEVQALSQKKVSRA